MNPPRLRPPLTIAALILSAAGVALWGFQPETGGDSSVAPAGDSVMAAAPGSFPAAASFDKKPVRSAMPASEGGRPVSAPVSPFLRSSRPDAADGFATTAAEGPGSAATPPETSLPAARALAGTSAAPLSLTDSLPVPVPPDTPGSTLRVDGLLVTVEAVSSTRPASASPALHIVIDGSPQPAVPVHGSTTAFPGAPGPSPVSVPEQTGLPLAPSGPPPATAGFSRQDELFRTRWGWAAWDAVRRAVREAPPGQNPG